MANLDYVRVNYAQPHPARTRQILAKHPEVKKLFGPTPSSTWYVLGIVALQVAVALALKDSSWWMILLAAYTVGAICNHALFVLIHDCTHNLAFRSSAYNKLLAIACNIPQVFPSAISFRKYHLLHHWHQGEMSYDADLAGPTEAWLIGNSRIKKTLWMLFFFVIEGIVRPFRLRNISFWDRWTALNLAFQTACMAAIVYAGGWIPIVYLLLSTIFSVGLHPVGARWIQEHYIFKPGQETYSYYGPLNKLCFNVGYHNEHHDLMMVPWSRLPDLRRMAPEFYDTLHYHTSWTGLLVKFIMDPTVDLYNRAVRPDRKPKPEAETPAAAAADVSTLGMAAEGVGSSA